ncbi:VENN motif-containing pre-toxin protein [Enterobacter sp. BIGb0383]|uniref:VENN motif pre-toxin domain-containing protein n=1 Tax=unclassified Enterobacter TaxID=2608935 RepID=UPI000F48CB8C|nr:MULTISPECIES: VENN motif pre-toxin domain-containing protein [unclassified Enterobacter]ROP60167.1 VENN motif-containing pre-toxin protein [Enterobacter sp. BIGb0383]ROS08366.1 VENN motif-containing pre-toxin protein [Enterobacter sp. BIGb0359]
MASTLLTGLGGSGNAEGTTQSAVADGTIIVRDVAHQQQDVSTLSRDTDHANGSIDPIFNKEKEQRRLQTAQLIGEIGRQVSDIVRTDAKIRATESAGKQMKTATADDRAAAIKALEKDKKAVTEEAISGQMYQTFYNDAFAKTEQGTGGQYQRAITAATAAIQAIAGGDIKGALAGAAAPYIANEIAKAIPEKDRAGRVLAHAVVNAALAAASGKDAGTAAAGAATGELAGMIALDAWGKTVDKLSEEEKQTVSALATLASGLVGGLVGDSGASAVEGAQAGKTTVENNRLSNKNEKEIISNLTDAAHDRQKLEAASCALIKCYAEYPVGSAEYEKNFALAQEGEKYQQEQQLLKNYELLTTELQDPLYWNKVPEEVKVKYQGFEYGQADQIADSQKAYDAWKIGYIADKLGVSPGVVELTSTGFNIGLIVAATSQAGKVVGNNLTQAGKNATDVAWRVPDSVSNKFPSGWGNATENKKGVGFRWQDPNNKGNGVRIDQGNPNISQPTQQVDHVIVRNNGKVIGRDGKSIQGSIADNAENAHIPLSEYKKWKNWNSPN